MVFDCLGLFLTAFNASARPRTQETALTSVLYKDGILYFLVRVTDSTMKVQKER